MSEIVDYTYLIKPLKKLAKVPPAKLGGVACFLIKNGAIISSGINHNPTGGPMEDVIDGKLVTRPEVVHAEIAALSAAEANAIDVTGSILLLTMSPCLRCAKIIAATNVAEVSYLYDWWDKASFDVLHAAGIRTKKLQEEL